MKHPLRVYRRWLAIYSQHGSKRHDIQKALVEEHRCLNCHTVYKGNFCPCCGQSAKVARFTLMQTVRDMLFFFAKFDNNTFNRTVLELCYRPGYMIRDYMRGHRADYMRPMQMLVCLITVYALLSYFFLPERTPTTVFDYCGGENTELTKMIMAHPILGASVKMFETFLNSRVMYTVAIVLFMALPARLCFRRTAIGRGFNIAEHFFAITYISCMTMLLDIVQLPYCALFRDNQDGSVISFVIVWLVYCQLFGISKRKGLVLTVAMHFLMLVEVVLVCIAVVLLFTSLGVFEFL